MTNKKKSPLAPHVIENRLRTAQKNYQSTVQKFTQEKNRFLQLYSQQGKIDAQQAEKEFYDKYFADFEPNEKYENEKMQKLSTDLLEKLRDSFTRAIETGDPAVVNQMATVASNTGDSKNLRGNKEYIQLAEQLFSSQQIEHIVEEQLNVLMEGTKGFPLSQFMDFALGLRRGIFYRLSQEPDTVTYITPEAVHTVKGYFAEAAVYKAYSQLAKELSKADITFEVEAIGGKNVAQDFQFNFNVPQHLSVTGSATVEEFYGQSKSWDRPEWAKEHAGIKTSSDFEIGHKTELVNKIIAAHKTARHSWSMMVQGMSEGDNAYEAMDKAVIWRLGHEMIWADTLMKSMISSNKYLSTSFTKADYSATNLVKWTARTRST